MGRIYGTRVFQEGDIKHIAARLVSSSSHVAGLQPKSSLPVTVGKEQGRHERPAVERHSDPLAHHLDPHARPAHVDEVLQAAGKENGEGLRMAKVAVL